MLSDLNILAIMARTEAASPGPWWLDETDPDAVSIHIAGGHDIRMGGADGPCRHDRRNAAFIAAARTDIPQLLTDRAALTAEVNRLCGLLQQAQAERDAVRAERDRLRFAQPEVWVSRAPELDFEPPGTRARHPWPPADPVAEPWPGGQKG